jgi:hypothetical protein
MENVIPDTLAAVWRSGIPTAFSLWALFMSLSQIAAEWQGREEARREAQAE